MSIPWEPLIEPALAQRAREIARAIGHAVREPDALVTVTPLHQGSEPSTAPAVPRDPSLAGGHAGVALLAAYLDACLPGEGWDRVGHRHLSAAVVDRDRLSALGPSLHGGWGGLTLAAAALARERPRYTAFLRVADEAVASGARHLVAEVERARRPLSPLLIDVIGGLSGVVAVLLTRSGQPEPRAALCTAVSALSGLGATVEGLPGVAAPPGWGQTDIGDATSPQINLGLAHGLPGLIAALSLARIHGVAVAGLHAAITEMVERLLTYRFHDAFGPLWPVAATVEPGHAPAHRPTPARMAWCYGAPGCARALWIAGTALDRAAWKLEALEAIRGAFRRPVESRGLGSPTFCHGDAGLLHIGLRFAVESGDRELGAALPTEVARLIAGYDPTSRFGYRSLDRAGRRQDSAGVLDGASGVALVLLGAASSVEPSWDRAFLLS